VSTVAAVACPAGVVLAGDRLVTSGGHVRSRSRRHVLDFDGVGVAVTGGDVSALADRLDAEIRAYRTEHRRLRIDAFARLVGDIAADFDAAVLVTAPDDGGVPRLRSVDPDGGITEESLAALGSGAALVLGVLEAGESPDTLDDAAALARDALAAAAERDPGTGTDTDIYRLPA